MPAPSGRAARIRQALLAAGVVLAAGAAAPSAWAADDGTPHRDLMPDRKTIEARFEQGLKDYDAGRYHAAYEAWLPLARNGDPAAQRNLGQLYRGGLGVAQDFSEAAAWYRRAADAGLASAQANLAMLYLRGQGVDKDAKQAAHWFLAAALQGHAIAQYNLGLMYLRGLGVERNEAKAAGWFYRAAKAGHRQSLEALGRLVPKISGVAGPPNPPPDARLDRDEAEATAPTPPAAATTTATPPPQTGTKTPAEADDRGFLDAVLDLFERPSVVAGPQGTDMQNGAH